MIICNEISENEEWQGLTEYHFSVSMDSKTLEEFKNEIANGISFKYDNEDKMRITYPKGWLYINKKSYDLESLNNLPNIKIKEIKASMCYGRWDFYITEE